MNVNRLANVLIAVFGAVVFVFTLMLLLSFSLSPPHAHADPLSLPGGVPRHVSPNGSDLGNDCANSLAPCRTVQHALSVAQDDDQILVAAGTYTGTMREFLPAWGGYVTATVVLTKNITALLGGYSVDFATRDPENNVSILSAMASPGDYVVFITGTNILLDGFTITGSEGSWGMGAGVRVEGGSPTISHNRIQDNRTSGWGAGICVRNNASPLISANLIYSNTAGQSGGGIYARTSAPAITGNVIISNTAGADGGGVAIRLSSASMLSNTIAHNSAAGTGGGILMNASTGVISDNQIYSNVAVNGVGGGVFALNGSSAQIVGNTIRMNEGGHSGGIGVYQSSIAWIVGNQILSNRARDWSGGGVRIFDGSTATLTGNTVQGNYTGDVGGGIQVDEWPSAASTAVITGNQIANNEATRGGGGINISRSTATLSNNEILSNSAHFGGGIALTGAIAHITSNEILSNTTRGWGGGGLKIEAASTVTMTDNLIAYNKATLGQQAAGGFDVHDSRIALLHNSIVSNTSYYEGAFILGAGTRGIVDSNLVAFNVTENEIDSCSAWSTDPIIFTNNVIAHNNGKITIYGQNTSVVNNTIADNYGGLMVWGNTAQASLVRNNVLANTYFGVMTGDGGTIAVLDYNDAWGNTLCDYCGLTGTGNILLDPQFVNPTTGDYHIRFGSPAMNAGLNAGAPPLDRDGVVRPQGSRVDMGAYEVVIHGLYLPLTLKNY